MLHKTGNFTLLTLLICLHEGNWISENLFTVLVQQCLKFKQNRETDFGFEPHYLKNQTSCVQLAEKRIFLQWEHIKQGENKTAKTEKEHSIVLTLIQLLLFVFLKPSISTSHKSTYPHQWGRFQTLNLQLFNYTGDTISYIALWEENINFTTKVQRYHKCQMP